MALSLLLAIGTALAAGFCLLDRFLRPPHDYREPPLVPSNIPVFGHAISLLRNGTEYYSQVAKRCGKPIFTLGLPGGKMYVVTSPSLVAACDKCARTVSFSPYIVAFAKRIMEASRTTIDLLSEDLLEDDGPVSLRPETNRAMHASLKRGDLNDTMRAELIGVLSFLDSADGIGDPNGVPLFHFVRRFVSAASTQALYGPKNPMQDLGIADDFWTIDKSFGRLGVNLSPSLTTPKAYRARERLFAAFRRYYASGGPDGASRFVKARYEVNKKYGIADEEIARFDLGVCTALLVNMVPAISWALYYAFSDQALLSRLRQGVEAAVALPLLESFIKEVLRVESHGSSARLVLEDTLISDSDGTRYWLRRNSVLAMPSALVHGSEAGWGPRAEAFDPSRFLEGRGDVKVAASSYRAFGGGRAICLGKPLAMNLMVSVLLVMILRYDVLPLDGCWEKPEPGNHISTSFLTPVKDVLVRIQPRKHGDRWNFVWESDT